MIPAPYPRKLPKAILFDWDNTLVDTWRVAFFAMNIARESVGKPPFTEAEFWQQPHNSMRDVKFELFGDRHEEGISRFYEHVEKFHLQEISVLEGAATLLETLGGLDIYLGIVSNKRGAFLRKEVAHLGWEPHFMKVIGSTDTKEDKPSKIPVLAALEQSNILPSHDVWFVGDSIVDVQCARASGCVPIVVRDGEAAKQNDVVHVQDCLGLAKLITSL